MTRGTDFGGVHSHRDLNLIQQKVEVQPAEPKLNLIKIPGADGTKDLSEQPAGRVVYDDRKISWTFALYPGDDWPAKHRQVSNALNGKRVPITLDEDPGYYYDGRLSVKKYKRDKSLRQITVQATCAPYMLHPDLTRAAAFFSTGKNLFDNTDPGIIDGAGCTLTATDTGIRLTIDDTGVSYKVLRSIPLQALVGRTVTLSTIAVASGGNLPLTRLGFTSTDGSRRATKQNTHDTTALLTLTVTEQDAEEYDFLGIWFYSNVSPSAGGSVPSVGDYIDYHDVQLEISSSATAYEPYSAATDAKELTLTNDRKPVTPSIICSRPIDLTVGGTTLSLNAGVHQVLDFQLEEGETPVSVSGSGAVAIVYREGSL